jgi:hypothetical protein
MKYPALQIAERSGLVLVDYSKPTGPVEAVHPAVLKAVNEALEWAAEQCEEMAEKLGGFGTGGVLRNMAENIREGKSQ